MLHQLPLKGIVCRCAPIVAALTCWLSVATRLPAELAFQEDFNGSRTIWKLPEADSSARILSQERVPLGVRDTAGSERIVAAAPAGDSLLLRCATARVAVLPELEIRLWVKSDRPAIQLAARVVLPRARDADSRAPTTLIVRGVAVNQPGHWQQLTLSDIPKLLAAEVRVLRATPGKTIDSREAFVDSVVLVVHGDPRGVEVLTDNLEVDGVVLPEADDIELTNYAAAESFGGAKSPIADLVRLHGGLLLVDDKPFLPRVIEWRSEPFALLQARGFNAVLLPAAPSKEQSAEAERHGLWFVCAAPHPETLVREGIGRSGDRVLAWYLDDEAIEVDPNYAFRWSDLVRQHDTVVGRPVVVAPKIDWTALSKSADILVAGHPRLGRASLEKYDEWLVRRPQLARPGTPIWAAFATQSGATAHQQSVVLSEKPRTPSTVDLGRLESLVQIAGTRGVRGFIFRSESSLAESDAATRARAAALELINYRLQLIEPWLAGGKVISRIESSDPAWSGVVFHVDRTRLLIPLRSTPPANTRERNQRAAPTTGSEIAYLVPGIPASSQAYALSSATMRTLSVQRVAGGTRLVLPASGEAMALITEDPQVIELLRRRVRREGPRFVRLRRDLVAQRAGLIAETARRLKELGIPNDATIRNVALVSDQLRQIDAQIAAGHLEEACGIIDSTNRVLEESAIEQCRSLDTNAAFDSNPLAMSYEQLADFASFQQSSRALRSGENLLYGGDFEDLEQIRRYGWRNFQHPHPGIGSRVELSAVEPKHGQYCLALHVASDGTSREPAVIESPCVQIVSHPMPVDRGQILEITGWVRIDEPLNGEGEGLQIVDSLGGPELALSIGQTSGWQPFRMVRAVAESSELRVTFALAGLGSARVDAVMVRELSSPTARRLPPAPSTEARRDGDTAEHPTRLRSFSRPR